MSTESSYPLADLIREQATAMNMSAANAYDAGMAEGFRRGVARAAELVNSSWTARDDTGDHIIYTFAQDVVRQIRALRLKP